MPDKPMKWPVQPSLTHGRSLYTGLVGLWPMWEGGGVGEGSIKDLTPNRNNGEQLGGPLWVADDGLVLSFDGVDDRVVIADDPALKDFTALSLAAWINPTASGGASASRIAHKSRTATADDYALNYISTDKLQLRINTDGGQTLLNGLTTITPNTGWYHALGTWDGSEMSVFLNGVSDATPVARTGTLTDNNQLFAIGAHEGTQTDRAFAGKIGIVTIWNRVLTAGEIAFLGAFPYAMIDPRGGKLGLLTRR